jgi:hypothetical protein
MPDSRFQSNDSLEGTVEAAREFGLSDAEVLNAVNSAAQHAEDEKTVAEFLDDLSLELARRILGKERRQSANSALRFSR